MISDFDMDSEVELDSDLSPNDDQDALNEDDVAEGSATSSSNDDDDNSEINAAFDDDGVSSDEDEVLPQPRKRRKVDGEAEYEVSGRGRWAPPSPKPEDDSVEVGRLPIKLQNGQVQRVEGMTRLPLPPSKRKPLVAEVEGEVEGHKLEEEQEESDDGAQAERMAGQKGRFGRLGVAEIVSSKGWKSRQRLEAAKEQIAAVGAEILAGGELADLVSATSLKLSG